MYFWDYERNFYKPSEVFPSAIVFLKCTENHSFKLSLLRASKMFEPCPYCGGRKPLAGVNDLSTVNPDIALQWSKENDSNPEDFLPQSNKVVLWDCDSIIYPHSYPMSVQKRVNGRGCPYCSNPARKILKGFNDFGSKYPSLVKEWSLKNLKEPSDYLSKSNFKVWWSCSKCSHEWVALICNRVAGTGCPNCCNSKSFSIVEREFLEFIEESLGSSKELISNSREVISPYELDVYIPGLKIAFEFNGDYWHRNDALKDVYGSSYEYHVLKQRLCLDKGIKLFFIWESDWKDRNSKVKDSVFSILQDSNIHQSILSKLFNF